MRYEHLIQINDPSSIVLTPLSREQVWMGLMQRVHAPHRFPLGPESCEVDLGADELTLRRRVHFGSLTLLDTVQVVPGRRLRFEPEAREDMVPVHLTITLESHPPESEDALFLRFLYESEVDDPETDGVRQQAWLANDRDMVRTLREWQDEGLL